MPIIDQFVKAINNTYTVIMVLDFLKTNKDHLKVRFSMN